VGWVTSNSGLTLHAVAGKKANDWGLYDMTGNLYEWTNDWYDATYGGYGTGTGSFDPAGPSSGTSRSFRGGSWYEVTATARVTDRYAYPPDFSNNDTGFRLARSNR
jgi:formylglycine-generating enzyme required for sulfatase activity